MIIKEAHLKLIDEIKWKSKTNYEDKLSYINEIKKKHNIKGEEFYIPNPNNAMIEGAEAQSYEKQEKESNERTFKEIDKYFKNKH